MSVYSVEGKGWRYDFTQKGTRYTNAWFKKKKDAQRAEAKRKEEITNPMPAAEIRTDTGFLELVNERLDHVKAYNTESHYWDYFYNARRWVKQWGKLMCKEISRNMVQKFMLGRSEASACAANQDLRHLRATFNFGKKKELIDVNPTQGIEFFPIEKRIKYVPPPQDIDKVIQMADPETQDYLWVIRETFARVSEINRLTWKDVSIDGKYIVLYTRKKKGGHLTPREVPMTEKVYDVLSRRFLVRDETKPWVFWHSYKSKKARKVVSGPYQDRKAVMGKLCAKAGVKYFRYHAIRHAGASIMYNENVPIGAIQNLLGHEKPTTTAIYLHSSGMAERQAMSIYEAARQNSHIKSHTDKKEGATLCVTP